MISFIIIGRNEGWKLTKCLQSVFNTVKTSNLQKYEVIYVDSKSSDDSIERVKLFSEVSIYQLTTIYNAAIARNLGANKAKGDVLFFIDGDMEISLEFLSLVYSEESGLKYPFVSGQLKNYNYNKQGKFLNNTWQYKQVLNGDRYFTTTGGIFLIERDIWKAVGGMDNRFKRGQDLELALSIAQKGIKILRKKEIIANHHTISYTHKTRLWKTLFSGDISYSNSFLLRKHILNPQAYVKIAKSNYTLLSFFFFLGISLFLHNFYFLSGYIIILIFKVYKQKKKNLLEIMELFLFYPVRDLVFLFYLFVPMKKINSTEIHFIKIQ